MKYDKLSLRSATQVDRAHNEDTPSPGLRRLRNFYMSKSDMVPTLRPDLEGKAEGPYDIFTSVGGTFNLEGSKDASEFLNVEFNTRSADELIEITRFGLMREQTTTFINTYTTGTCNATATTDQITGSGTLWMSNLWAGCLIKIGTNVYEVESVESNIALTITGTIQATVSGSAYTAYQTHNSDHALWPCKVEAFNDFYIYKPVKPVGRVLKDGISGPFVLDATDASGTGSERFEPLDDFIRAQAFAVINNYTVLGHTRELEIQEHSSLTELLGRQIFEGPIALGGTATTGDSDGTYTFVDFEDGTGTYDVSTPTDVDDYIIVATEPTAVGSPGDFLSHRRLIKGVDYERTDATRITFIDGDNAVLDASSELLREGSSGDLNPLPEDWRIYAANKRSNTDFGGGFPAWVQYPRRIRWTVPGTVCDLDGVGSGFADLPGDGDILDIVRVGSVLVVFESTRVALLEPSGALDAPFTYRVIKEQHVAISNKLVIDETCYWVASDGLMYTSNGFEVSPVPWGFDITEYEDIEYSTPIWITYSIHLQQILVLLPNAAGSEHICWAIQPESGLLTEFEFPEGASQGSTLVPKSIGQSQDPATNTLWVGYGADGFEATSGYVVTASFDTDDGVTGIDDIDSNFSVRWVGELQTGEILLPEGSKGSIQQIIVGTLNDSGDDPPDVVAQVASREAPTTWQDEGADAGTISVTTSQADGTNTTWAFKIGEGDDSTTAFSTPVAATQCRIYIDSTEQTLTTDYTITGTQQITFVTPPSSTGPEEIYAYWQNAPHPGKVTVGDMILTSEGWHRVDSIDDAFTIQPAWDPSTTLTGTHHPAVEMPAGEGEVAIGMMKLCEDLRIRLIVVPQDTSTCRVNKILSLTVGYIPMGGRVNV